MSGVTLNTIPPLMPQIQISCPQGQLRLVYENKMVRAWLIEPSGEMRSVTVEDLPKGLTSEKIQAFLKQSYVKLSALNESGAMIARLYTRGLGGGKVEALKDELDAKGKDKKAVFISYQWDHKDLATALEAALVAEGIMVLRDELAFQQSGEDLNAFMQLINHPNLDKVISIVSDKYLKSPNCMEEILETMKRFEWKKSLIPIVVEGDLYQRGSESSYIKYWKENQGKWDSKRDKDLAIIASTQLEDFFANIRFTIQDDVKSLQKDNFKGIVNRIVGDEANRPASDAPPKPMEVHLFTEGFKAGNTPSTHRREYKIEGLFEETFKRTEKLRKDFEVLYKKMENPPTKNPASEVMPQSIQRSQYNNKNSKVGIQGDNAQVQTMKF